MCQFLSEMEWRRCRVLHSFSGVLLCPCSAQCFAPHSHCCLNWLDRSIYSLKSEAKYSLQINSKGQFIFCQDYLSFLCTFYSIHYSPFLYCLLFMGMKNLFCCLLFIYFWKSNSVWLLPILTLSFLFFILQIIFPLCLSLCHFAIVLGFTCGYLFN